MTTITATRTISGAARGGATVLLVAALLGTWIWAVAQPSAPERPPPAFPDGWETESPPESGHLAGVWDAWESGPDGDAHANACRIRFQRGRFGLVRIRAEAAVRGGWTSWGRGHLDGRVLRFDWTGPRGWAGDARLTFDEEFETFDGEFTRAGEDAPLAVAGRRAR